MAKNIVQTLNSNFIDKDFKAKHWIVDFIESVDGITYFLQIKEIKLERLDKIGMLKRKLIKDKYKIHAKSLNLLLTSKFITH